MNFAVKVVHMVYVTSVVMHTRYRHSPRNAAISFVPPGILAVALAGAVVQQVHTAVVMAMAVVRTVRVA